MLQRGPFYSRLVGVDIVVPGIFISRRPEGVISRRRIARARARSNKAPTSKSKTGSAQAQGEVK